MKDLKYGYLLFRIYGHAQYMPEYSYINYILINNEKKAKKKEFYIRKYYFENADWGLLVEDRKKLASKQDNYEIIAEGLTLEQAKSRKIYYIKKYHSVSSGLNSKKDFSGKDYIKGKGNYCVYLHISPNHKYYVGITSKKYPKDRWGKNGIGYKEQKKFYRAILKYGWDNFEHKILKRGLDEESALFLEQQYIFEYNSVENGYNVLYGYEDTSNIILMHINMNS